MYNFRKQRGILANCWWLTSQGGNDDSFSEWEVVLMNDLCELISQLCELLKQLEKLLDEVEYIAIKRTKK